MFSCTHLCSNISTLKCCNQVSAMILFHIILSIGLNANRHSLHNCRCNGIRVYFNISSRVHLYSVSSNFVHRQSPVTSGCWYHILSHPFSSYVRALYCSFVLITLSCFMIIHKPTKLWQKASNGHGSYFVCYIQHDRHLSVLPKFGFVVTSYVQNHLSWIMCERRKGSGT